MQTTATPSSHTPGQMAFRQKSIGISLFVVGSSAIYYGIRVAEMMQTTPLIGRAATASPLPTGFVPLVISVVVALVIVEIVLQSVLAIGQGQLATATTRDKEVTLKATRNSYYLLITGVIAVVASSLLGMHQFFTVNLLLGAFVLAEIVKLISQLVYYRQAR